MATKRSTRDPYADQAGLEALLRFGPQTAALKALIRQAEANYTTGLRQSSAGAEGIIGAVDRARPQVARIYDAAGLEQARTANTLIGRDLAALGPVADSIKGGAALEQTAGLRHLQESKASALTGLQDRKVSAREGALFAGQNAHRQLVSELTRLFEAKRDLSEQSGTFKALTARQLRQHAEEQAQQLEIAEGGWNQSERNSLRSSGIDPSTGEPIPGGKLDPKKKKGERSAAGGRTALSPDKHNEWASSIEAITQRAQRYVGKASRQEIVAKLVSGRPAQTVWVVKGPDGKTHRVPDAEGPRTPGAVKKALPAIPQHQADLRMTAALDVAIDGHLSRATARKLQKRGFILKELGLPTYGEWARAKRQSGAARAPR